MPPDPYDPFPDISIDEVFPLVPRSRTVLRFQRIAGIGVSEPVEVVDTPLHHLGQPPIDELDEWRTTYGRLDIPVTLIDWRPIAAGVAALTLAAIAHRMVRHGR